MLEGALHVAVKSALCQCHCAAVERGRRVLANMQGVVFKSARKNGECIAVSRAYERLGNGGALLFVHPIVALHGRLRRIKAVLCIERVRKDRHYGTVRNGADPCDCVGRRR